MPGSIKKLYLSTASISGISAIVNMLTTVMMTRWLGAVVYADYIVDLAGLALLMICLEIVPSSYSVFRVQDKPERIRGIAALCLTCAFGSFGAVLLIHNTIGGFRGYSVWIAFYAAAVAFKRYFDIHLQATGRLGEFFGIDLAAAVIRLGLLGAIIWLGGKPSDAVWGALAIATLSAQVAWLARNPTESKIFIYVFSIATWRPLFAERRAYFPYYLGIALKRLRDNMVPLMAGVFFAGKEATGIFFLAYRGLIFTCGQIRVIEGLLNHRKTLEVVMALPLVKRIVIAIIGQIICFAASVALAYMSGVSELPLVTAALLSFIVWFYVFTILQRAESYSRYSLSGINASMATYIALAAGLVYSLRFLGLNGSSFFVGALIAAESGALFILLRLSRHST